MFQILLAIFAGIITVAAPCILLPLPILLGTSIGQSSKTRPLFITLGFVLTFSALGLSLNFLIQHLGLSPNALRNGGGVILAIFAFFMIWPTPFERLMAHASGLINAAARTGQKAGRGNWGGLILGITIGAVWAPCAGPVLGTILTLIARQADLGRASVLLIAYGIGAGLPMLVIAYGGQYLTTRIRLVAKYSTRLQQIFGVIILLLAVAIFYQYDTFVVAKLSAFLPSFNINEPGLNDGAAKPQFGTQNSSTKINLSDYGPAPELAGINNWINSKPLTLADLRGKVVLIDFWTYSCINCLRTLPYVTKWYDKYKDDGLVIIGVHTPEFAFEKIASNVEAAVKQLGIHYPVAQDNDYKTWDNYNNRYWPAEYLIDQRGHLVHTHFGEGEYATTENAIRQLLGLNGDMKEDNGQDLSQVRSPEIYFGTDRLENLSQTQKPQRSASNYTLPLNLSLNDFALQGNWRFDPDKAVLVSGRGKIRLHFSAGKVHLVASSDKPIMVGVLIDGSPSKLIIIQQSQLYTLFDSTNYGDHILELDIPEPGVEAYTFTFG
ncbi:cytochrome c biogenesis protein DipZ [Candidatus Uhrbacteria bacterium]|nr:cytochrome c biogenesis protein DipZ [Candidatus Uhrbacteria bacterium]